MTLADAEMLALDILKQVMEEKINATNVEVAAITINNPIFTIYEKDQVDTILKKLK